MEKNTVVVGLVILCIGFFGCGRAPKDTVGTAAEDSLPNAEPIQPAEVEQRSRQRLEWNLQTTVRDYEKTGHHDPRWDEDAKQALSSFARTRVPGAAHPDDFGLKPFAWATNAIAAGCKDPMVVYLQVKGKHGSPEGSTAEIAREWMDAGDALLASHYSPIRKFYGAIRAMQACHAITVQDAVPPETGRFWNALLRQADMVLRDPATPVQEAYEVVHEVFEVARGGPQQREQLHQTYEKQLFAHYPRSMYPWLVKGEFYVSFAWDARGDGYADTVSTQGWEGFREQLTEAEKALETAWKIEPHERVALAMLRVELGQGRGQDRMELWFERAMKLNPSCYEACWLKSEYLHPKWYGSEEEVLAFGRQCVLSTNWTGRVPLILAQTHETLAQWKERDKEKQMAYWKQPGVWEDVKSAFERFFGLNPDALHWRHIYARAAFSCVQYETFLQQVQVYSATNHSYFGGAAEFERMIKMATEQHAAYK